MAAIVEASMLGEGIVQAAGTMYRFSKPAGVRRALFALLAGDKFQLEDNGAVMSAGFGCGFVVDLPHGCNAVLCSRLGTVTWLPNEGSGIAFAPSEIGAAVASAVPTAADIGGEVSFQSVKRWVSRFNGKLSDVFGSSLSDGTYYLTLDGGSPYVGSTLVSVQDKAWNNERPYAEAYRVTTWNQGALSGTGNMTLSIVKELSPEVLQAVATLSASGALGSARLERRNGSEKNGYGMVILKAVIAGGGVGALANGAINIDSWELS